jgi:proton-dependent oligopeptide transporter, POT family
MMAQAPRDVPAAAVQPRELFGHPKGLTVLFTTEMWERFSYFGMSALVVLYMTKYLFQPGQVENVLGYGAVKAALESLFGPLGRQPLASLIYGFYTGLAYLTPILGGLVADRLLGQRRTVVVGALLMSCGHFMMTFEALFFPALACIILGNGAFKPNVSTQVGGLYQPGDPRALRAYTIFYLGINIGAFMAPLVCGTLGEQVGWHYGFAAAGIGMLVCIVIYLSGWRSLPADEFTKSRAVAEHRPLTARERRAVLALLLLCAIVALYWAAYDQQGNTLLLWAADFTQRSVDLGVWQGTIPTTWFLALNPLMIFIFTPLTLKLWETQLRLGIEPSITTKMAFGCLSVAAANLVMALAAAELAPGEKASALWLVAYFALVTVGELHLAPVGLALMARVAPGKVLSMMMGVWFATTFPGDLLGGYLGSFWSSMAKADFFLMIAAVGAFAGFAIMAVGRPLRSILQE